MKNIWRKIFNKPNENDVILPTNETTKFVVRIKSLEIGYLTFEKGYWIFEYTDAFRNQDKYRRLVGFSDTKKVYTSEVLWPFFKIRIPGLKQPLVQEILKKEKIDKNNEAMLLKKFGRNNISNAYVLETI